MNAMPPLQTGVISLEFGVLDRSAIQLRLSSNLVVHRTPWSAFVSATFQCAANTPRNDTLALRLWIHTDPLHQLHPDLVSPADPP